MTEDDTVINFGRAAKREVATVASEVVEQLGNFYYVTDFLVVKEEETKVNIILGWPFILAARALINCATGVVQFTFDYKRAMMNTRTSFSMLLPIDAKAVRKHEFMMSKDRDKLTFWRGCASWDTESNSDITLDKGMEGAKMEFDTYKPNPLSFNQ